MVDSRKFPAYQKESYQLSQPTTSNFESSAFEQNRLIRWTSVEPNESQRDVPRTMAQSTMTLPRPSTKRFRTTTLPNDSQPSTKRMSVDEMSLWMDSLPDPPTFPIDRGFNERLISDFNQKKKRVLRIPQIPIDRRQEIEFSSTAPKISLQTFHPIKRQPITKRFTEVNRIDTTKRLPLRFGNDRCTDL